MKGKAHKEFIAKDKVELPYVPGNIFCCGFLYFNKDLMMITGTQDQIVHFVDKNFSDRLTVLVIHEYKKWKSNSIENLNIINIPAKIGAKGIDVVIQRRQADHDSLPRLDASKFNPNHYYRMIGFANGEKILLSSYKRMPRCVPDIIKQWLELLGVDDVDAMGSYPEEFNFEITGTTGESDEMTEMTELTELTEMFEELGLG